MRNTKFRGLSINKSEWWYGNLNYNRCLYEGEDDRVWIAALSRKTGNVDQFLNLCHFSEVHPETVGEFTGLKDKNGQDIYEGDIVGGYPHATVTVRWCDEYACFECYWTEQGEREEDGEMVDVERTPLFANELNNCKDTWVVIGNIHETK